MAELNLDFDEGILFSTEDVAWISSDIDLDEMILTNKNLYFAYSKSNGLFAKPTEEVVIKPLSDIKIISGKPMVDQVKNARYGVCLQIQFVQSRDLFAFRTEGRSLSAQWVNELYKILVGTEAPVQVKTSSFGGFGSFGSFADLKDTFKNAAESAVGTVSEVAGSAMGTMTEMAKQAADGAVDSFENAKEQYKADRQDVPINIQTGTPQPSGGFCSNCGTKLDSGAKFCPGCGTPVGTSAASSTPPVPPNAGNPSERQQEFAGTILKCPNCGASIGQTTAVCPECGHHITGQAAVSSVQTFANQLMALESRRKRGGLGQMLGLGTDPVDSQKLALIRSFPIPNTIDDIQEFMLLAIANIDVGLSKKSLNNMYQSKMKSGETSLTMPRTISDAWVSKMQQAYQKASTAFPNEPIFAHIKQIYLDKMRELKMKVDG